MRIAVCDDDKLCREKIINLLWEYKRIKQDLSLSLSAFSSADELLNSIDECGRFDLYILDVIMPEISGIQLGSALRMSGDEGMIIYLTTSPEFAVDSYAVEAFYYLLKPIDTISLFQCLDKAADCFFRNQKNVITVRTSNSVRIVPVHSICYAERVSRRICYHISDGTVINSATFNGTFQNTVAPLLEHGEILLVGSSFAVNMNYVTEITRRDLIIAGERRIAIPRGKYEEYKTEWADYWLNGRTL
ncbi:MAG: response regulator [Lachnospiraceae bacterium]|nr:response regulator [Lachnospiraceae bacterium]